ncbi:ABC transporter ATP-binding protein [Natronococcus sp. A-GB7]|uniref:ABC transporter ATP-binding protein n=1 Tax=Natronococcus sp. A-GB7 TaxID=3037649 RepID=UPI00241C1802|nr:ABC transporter ATP-binding protein [Natronococcus sp. A-GB7]MDG5820745.1 ABC transporter ATP-binding protein [Natronococcus sp. A-GB7]
MSIVSIQDLRKEFGNVTAVEGANFDIEEGEFVSVLGPSGSGKSTILRMIAGFESPTSGSIEILGKEVVGMAPFEREVNMVFQDLALFPHLTVAENIKYGLQQKGVSKDEQQRRATEMLEIVDLAGYGNRDIDQLSGGEQQRVALARALVNEPSVVLFDEPLASLDRKLRQRMQFELQQIQEETGITFLYVTHDQEVAMSVSDRMVVLNEGKIEQIGTPEEIYRDPESQFVAQFIGDLNSVYSKVVEANDDTVEVQTNGTLVRVPVMETTTPALNAEAVDIGVRPQNVTLQQTSSNGDGTAFEIGGTVINRMYRGDNIAYIVDTEDEEFLVIEQQDTRTEFEIGEDVYVQWKTDDCLVFPSKEVA